MALLGLALGCFFLLASNRLRSHVGTWTKRAPLQCVVQDCSKALRRISRRQSSHQYESFQWAEKPAARIGHGFDIHRLAARSDPEVVGPVILGGVIFDDIDLGIVAHSDGDVVYHSIVDAIFGALTLPDIGQFFPDTDPRWKRTTSDIFMEEAWQQMDQQGYRVGNVDVTIIAQTPRMIVMNHPAAEPGKPYDYKNEMVENIASLLRCPLSRVNVKARTHEKVDAVGEKRAISCHVVVILERAQ